MRNERDEVIKIFLSNYKGGCSCFPEDRKELEEHYRFHFDGQGNRFERPELSGIAGKCTGIYRSNSWNKKYHIKCCYEERYGDE